MHSLHELKNLLRKQDSKSICRICKESDPILLSATVEMDKFHLFLHNNNSETIWESTFDKSKFDS